VNELNPNALRLLSLILLLIPSALPVERRCLK
jgi:hypothetical protein